TSLVQVQMEVHVACSSPPYSFTRAADKKPTCDLERGKKINQKTQMLKQLQRFIKVTLVQFII
ncbi:hypothetical protein DVA76_18840, partial [Acinetobacter baumannii]